jgi:hypothetical protein
VVALGPPPHRAHDHQIRRSGQVVQDRPSSVVGWADIPVLSTCVGRCPAAWQQCWQQSRRNGLVPDRLLFRPDVSASCRALCERLAVSPIAVACCWLLLLLSRLLLAQANCPAASRVRQQVDPDRGAYRGKLGSVCISTFR